MIYLKQSTASQEILIGPFVDATDGVTAETGLTIANTDIKIHKAGATTLADKNSGGATHISGGLYYAVLDATDTNTLGSGQIHVSVSGALPCKVDFTVLPANIYDSMIAGTDLFDVSVTQWTGTAVATPDTAGYPKVTVKSGTGTGEISLSSGEVTPTTASKTGYRLSATGVDDIWDEAVSGHVTAGSTGASLYQVRSATAQAGASTTITLDASASAVNDFYNNQIIYIVSGTGAGQSRIISDYDGGTKVATVPTWGTNPSSDSVFVIAPFGSIPGASAPTAAEVADAVWDEAMADHRAEGSFGTMLQGFHSGTAQAGASNTITLDSSGSSATTDFYKYAVVEIVSGTGIGQSRQITAYNGSSKVATVDPAWTTAPDNTSNYVVRGLGIDAATTGQIADAVWDEPRSGHIAAGSFGEYVLADSVRVSGSSSAADLLEAATAGSTPLPANVTQISGDSVAADNLEAYTDGTTPMPVNATHISGDSTAADNLEAALDGTGGVTIDAAIEIRSTGGSAGHNAADLVTSVLTTQMTESYAADGVAPTVAQALFAIQQFLLDKDVSGTTLTVRRLDGTTSAFVLTLDDGTNPTDINRTA